MTSLADRPSTPLGSESLPPDRSARERFRGHLRKIGSGEHTSRGLSREEARDALELMLTGGASPAQIGAFLIAHRIRRPEPQELAGMLDVYRAWGPRLSSSRRALCFGMPFDGRSRTAPVYPLTALVLAAAGLPVVLTGAGRMPVKYGITPRELFALLGLELGGLSLARLQEGLERHGLALLHQPDHFPLAGALIEVREELGKRPPIASVELLWTPHRGPHLLASGYVHPPTESRAWEALRLAGESDVVTVKGLEGSTDLPVSRACVTARVRDGRSTRTILHPRDHGCFGPDALWAGEAPWAAQAGAALEGEGELAGAVIWNAGAYLWFAGAAGELAEGIEQAAALLRGGAARARLDDLIRWRGAPAGAAAAEPGCREGWPDPAGGGSAGPRP
ncbi:MAG: anthranilate phosphoribosyltransferase family protein [Synechococcaceae cyanobacterium]|nr:anthranilate phosphoribosyltransferase family protein [Synechococcaceae cyanobacterium]